MCKILVIANYFCRGHDLSFLFFYVDQYLLALRLCQNWVDTVGLSSRGCLRPAISSEITNYFHLQLMMQLWNITVNVGCNLAHILVKFTNSLFFVRQVEGNIYQQCRQRSAGLSVFEKVSPPPPLPPPPPPSRVSGSFGQLLWAFVLTCEFYNASNSMWKDTISSIKSWVIVDISAIVLGNKNCKKQFFPRDFLSIIFNCLSYQE